ncbi:MAG: hypothetical protein R2709_01935 [Marmoricola sp.]
MTLDVKGKKHTVKANYVHLAAGYYDYDKGNDPEFVGRAGFKGRSGIRSSGQKTPSMPARRSS